MTDDTRLQDIQRVLERIGYYADADTLRDVGQELVALRAQVRQQALDLITARSEAEEAHADAQRYKRELLNIADTKRFKRDVFDTDSDWADWAQSRARYVSSGDAAADEAVKKAAP